MGSRGLRGVLSVVACTCILTLAGAAPSWCASPSPVGAAMDASTLKDATHALDLAVRWLEAAQHPDGSWSQSQFPALTALAVMALSRDPRRDPSAPLSPAVEKGVQFLLRCVQPDGGIYVPPDKGGGLPVYNTALGLTALAGADPERFRTQIARAHDMLVGAQYLGEGPSHGGFGYDAANPNKAADLSGTHLALEAVRLAEELKVTDAQAGPEAHKLDWNAAVQFLSRVQNLPGSNDLAWASSPSAEDLGGFVYSPEESKAGTDTTAGGSLRLHSYGSMTYAGLLSFIYADVGRSDPRVTAAVDWVRRHYTVEENPGMGADGLFYNYHTMTKALSFWGEEPLQLPGGHAAAWRKDLVLKLVTSQRIDPKSSFGYWVNDSGRWWENDPVLATSYALNTLDILLSGAVKH